MGGGPLFNRKHYFHIKETCGGDICLENGAECVSEEFSNGMQIEKCRCLDGLIGDGITWCMDFNECSGNNVINLVQDFISWDNVSIARELCGSECNVTYNGQATLIAPLQCSKDAWCVNEYSGSRCVCLSGYFGDGETCSPVDPCENITCPQMSQCLPVGMSATCQCASGLLLSGNECINIPECDSSPCLGNANCVETFGSYQCTCLDGYGGQDCGNINECSLNVGVCGNFADCIDTNGSYTCRCLAGYTQSVNSNICEDIDECSSLPCSQNSRCQNTPGSYQCICDGEFRLVNGSCVPVDPCQDNNPCLQQTECVVYNNVTICICPSGFLGNGIDFCVDLDECINSPCQRYASCNNTEGSYSCTCNTGFSPVESQCEDINECLSQSHSCTANQICENTIGSYLCSCKQGYVYNQGISDCVDVNECAVNGTCGSNSVCVNSPGSFECDCLDGYERNQAGNCVELLPCETNICNKNATCTVQNGQIICICPEGFTGGISECQDINECLSFPCDQSADCSNTVGSYLCACKENYLGDGKVCIFDSCVSNPCGINADCLNIPNGAYECVCKEGFYGANCDPITPCNPDNCGQSGTCFIDGQGYVCDCLQGYEFKNGTCVEVNECTAQISPCGFGSDCVNTEGSFICECLPGFLESSGSCEGCVVGRGFQA